MMDGSTLLTIAMVAMMGSMASLGREPS